VKSSLNVAFRQNSQLTITPFHRTWRTCVGSFGRSFRLRSLATVQFVSEIQKKGCETCSLLVDEIGEQVTNQDGGEEKRRNHQESDYDQIDPGPRVGEIQRISIYPIEKERGAALWQKDTPQTSTGRVL
jgi:hypothetical protein